MVTGLHMYWKQVRNYLVGVNNVVNQGQVVLQTFASHEDAQSFLDRGHGDCVRPVLALQERRMKYI